MPFLFPCSSTSERVLTRTPLPTSVAGRLTAPLVLISLPSRSQRPAQLQPCSVTCWTRCTRLQSQGALLASRFPLGYYRSHPPGYRFPEQPTGLRKGLGLGLWRRAGWPFQCHSGGGSPALFTPPFRGLTGTGGAAVLGPRGQELAGGTAHQAGTLPPVTAKAGSSLRLQLNERASRGWVPGHGSREPPSFLWTPGSSICLGQVRLQCAERLSVSSDLLLTPCPDPRR